MAIFEITAENIVRAADLLCAGGLIAFPTETVYGLGANAFDVHAVAQIYTAKGRPSNNPLIVHVADMEAAVGLVSRWPDTASRLAEEFWPGPLTLVLPRGDCVPDITAAGGPTVAIRVPAHRVARQLLEAADIPIAAPSANRSGEISPTTAEHVYRSLGERVTMILDGGPTTAGIESTVVDLSGDIPRLLRPGPISLARLSAILGEILLPHAPSDMRSSLPSPGMLSRHYAPRTPLEVFDSSDLFAHRRRNLRAEGRRVGILDLSGRNVPQVEAGLYAAMHELDADGYEHLICLLPPDTAEWLAVRDRLTRASRPHSPAQEDRL